MPAHRKPTHRPKIVAAALGTALACSGVAFVALRGVPILERASGRENVLDLKPHLPAVRRGNGLERKQHPLGRFLAQHEIAVRVDNGGEKAAVTVRERRQPAGPFRRRFRCLGRRVSRL